MKEFLSKVWQERTSPSALSLAQQRWGPRDLGKWGAGLLALGLAALFVYSFQLATYPDEPAPKGLALLLPGENFTWLHEPGAYEVCFVIVCVASLALAANRLLWLVLPALTFLHLAAGTLVNSQQEEPGHKYQLVALALLTLWAWDWFARWRAKRSGVQKGWGLWRANSVRWWSVAAWLLIQVMAASYLVSVVSKLILSDFEWIERTANFPIQMMKTSLAEYYNTLEGPEPGEFRAQLDESASWWQSWQEQARVWVVKTPYLATVLLGAGFLVEALAFLALRGRIWALALGVGLIGMHLSIQVLMQLEFEIHLALLVLLYLNLPFWLGRGVELCLPAKKVRDAGAAG